MIGLPLIWLAALGDLLGRPLRGLLLLCLVLAAALLTVVTYAALSFLLPLIPDATAWWTGWLDEAARFFAGAGAIVIALLLYPMVSLIVGGALFDVAAGRVESLRFPGDPPARAMAWHEGAIAGVKLAPAALALNALALPLVFIPVVNVILFTALNAFLMGREYFTLAALRFRPLVEARALRRKHGVAIYAAALAPALLVGLPTMLPIAPFLMPLVAIVSFPAPLLGAAIMVRLHKHLAR